MSEINPTDHKSITARNIPRNNTRVEADFSIWRDYGPSKRHYRVHHVWCLDPENTKDFFEKVWDYQVINTKLRFFRCIDSCSITRILQENDVPLLHRAACKEFVSLVQKAFRDSCNRYLVPYEVKPNPSPPCKRQRSSDPPLPTSPPHIPNPRTRKSNFLCRPRGIPTQGRSETFPIES